VLDGHEISVLTAQPNYNGVVLPVQPSNEILGGVSIKRVSLLRADKNQRLRRILNTGWFLLAAIWYSVRGPRMDLVMASSHPPVLMGMTLRFIRFLSGAPYLLHYQDIQPESAIQAGQLRWGLHSRWLLRQDCRSCAQARCVVTLSNDMRRVLLRREKAGIQENRVLVANNFAIDRYRVVDDQELSSVLQLPPFPSTDPVFRVIFAGNMGRYQNLRVLVEAARILANRESIQFLFMGSGEEYAVVRELARGMLNRTVWFYPQQSAEIAFAAMERSDLGLVSLAPGVAQVAFPSKTMTYLAAGIPVLLLADRDACIASEIVSQDFGYVARELTSAAIAEAIAFAYDDRGRWSRSARTALTKRADNNYGRGPALESWSRLIRTIESSGDRWTVHWDRAVGPGAAKFVCASI
jgi:glycosyltransferase involved in cell wall biosynthesis